MRRRSRDVFELGQEQLLDERAVELVEPEGPPVPPPAAGSAAEAKGSEEPRAGAAEHARTQPRAPSLGRFRRHGVVAAGITSVVLGTAAAIGVRGSLEGDGEGLALSPRREVGERGLTGADKRSDGRSRRTQAADGSGPRRETDSGGASARPVGEGSEQATAAPGESAVPMDTTAAAGHVPAGAVAEAPAVSDASPQVATREIVAREFGP